MYIAALLLGAAAALASPYQRPLAAQTHRETMEEAVESVVHLVRTVGKGTMASVFPPGSDNAGYPFALMEAHAPCHADGALTFISMPISLMQRNLRGTGGGASYALATPTNGRHNEYALPRVSFIGNLTVLDDVSDKEHERLRDCFVEYHPDAKWWIPEDPRGAHVSHWAKLSPQDIYYIGGFGTTGWIGHIPLDKYAKAMEK